MRRFRPGNIKVRHAVTFILVVLFLFLVFSHGPPAVSKSEMSKKLKMTESLKYDKNRKNHKLQQTLQKVKDKHNILLDVIKNKKTDEDDIPQYNTDIKRNQTVDKIIIFRNGGAGKPVFQPPNFFDDDIKDKVDLINKQLLKGKNEHNNSTKNKQRVQNLNKDLDDPNKQLNLRYINDDIHKLVYYKKDEPLIWVTGHPRSGTTLMRAMLDAHPDIRCGEETHIIPRILGAHGGMVHNEIQMGRLNEANIDERVIGNALGAYIMTVIAQHGEPATRLCNKDPMTIMNAQMIKHIFPNSKFIFMIRDGRAVVHSIMSRKVGIQGFDRSSHKGGLRSWNMIMTRMYYACQDLGPDICLPVYYEQLVLHPQYQMKHILSFLGIEWNDIVLHHHETVGKKGGVSLSKKEFSTDQVEKPINLMSMSSWVKDFPEDARLATREMAPLLEILGYDPDSYPPNYGEPDPEVVENTNQVEIRKQMKKRMKINTTFEGEGNILLSKGQRVEKPENLHNEQKSLREKKQTEKRSQNGQVQGQAQNKYIQRPAQNKQKDKNEQNEQVERQTQNKQLKGPAQNKQKGKNEQNEQVERQTQNKQLKGPAQNKQKGKNEQNEQVERQSQNKQLKGPAQNKQKGKNEQNEQVERQTQNKQLKGPAQNKQKGKNEQNEQVERQSQNKQLKGPAQNKQKDKNEQNEQVERQSQNKQLKGPAQNKQKDKNEQNEQVERQTQNKQLKGPAQNKQKGKNEQNEQVERQTQNKQLKGPAQNKQKGKNEQNEQVERQSQNKQLKGPAQNKQKDKNEQNEQVERQSQNKQLKGPAQNKQKDKNQQNEQLE